MTDKTKAKGGGIGETIRLLIEAGLIALGIQAFLFQPFNIPSGSMMATLLVGDYLFVSKYSYGYSRFSFPFSLPLFSGRIMPSRPERGEIVVFRLPADTSTDYIKRVIGLPGDRVQMVDGVVNINGQPVKREQIDDYVDHDENPRGTKVRRWRETLSNGVTYNTLDLPYNLQADNTEVFTVPPDHYFMMGDNRHNSTDSRYPQVGYVPFENIIGRAQIVFFSLLEGERAWEVWRWPWSVRWNRLLTVVR